MANNATTSKNSHSNKPKAIQVGGGAAPALSKPSNDTGNEAPKTVAATTPKAQPTVAPKATKKSAAKPKPAKAKKVETKKAKPSTAAKKPTTKAVKKAAKPSQKKTSAPAASKAKSAPAKKVGHTSHAGRDWVFAFADQWQYGTDHMASWFEDVAPYFAIDPTKFSSDLSTFALDPAMFSLSPEHFAVDTKQLGLDGTKEFMSAHVEAQQYATEKTGNYYSALHDVANQFYAESLDVAKSWLQLRDASDAAELQQRQLSSVNDALFASWNAWCDYTAGTSKEAFEPLNNWTQQATQYWLDASKKFAA